ncbi:MAG: DEAD/DEAH box helicase [Phycisphaerales bacterium]|nr:MAG: DEAD/DEAH box helicase [Phycisphaerales bacterium]
METVSLQSFESLGLSKPILKAIASEGYDTPTPIQAGAIPPALEGRDVLGGAQTGTGKTAAFALPLIDRLTSVPTDRPRRGTVAPRALILSPTRELATQIAESAQAYARHTKLRGCTIYGGVSQHNQVKKLRAGVDIIVATPGRLMDLMNQGYVDLGCIEILVLDEADRMLDMGFINPIRKIAAQIPEERQTLMFSATMPPPIAKLARTLLRDPVRVDIAPSETRALRIEQSLHMVDQPQKADLLERMLQEPSVERAIVFTRTKHGAENLSKRLVRGGVFAESIHGDRSQNQRRRALDAFRAGRTRVLVATDVAARGIDVDGVTHVFNFHLPNEPEAYVHRIGRTGRAGAAGIAVSFCDRGERSLLKAIERHTGQKLAPGKAPTGTTARPSAPIEREPQEFAEPKPTQSRRKPPAQAKHRAGKPAPEQAAFGAPTRANKKKKSPHPLQGADRVTSKPGDRPATKKKRRRKGTFNTRGTAAAPKSSPRAAR